MHRQISKRIVIYLFIFILLTTLINNNLSKSKLLLINSFEIIGLNDLEKNQISQNLNVLRNKNLYIRSPNSTRPWQHVLESLYGYIILAEKIFGNKQKKYCTSWNFGPSRKKNLKVIRFAKILKFKMKTKLNIIEIT